MRGQRVREGTEERGGEVKGEERGERIRKRVRGGRCGAVRGDKMAPKLCPARQVSITRSSAG